MKTVLANVWKPRWCRMLLGGAFVCALLLAHPYVRQSMFGPLIDDIPWCVWEDAIRADAHADDSKTWFYAALEKIGLFDSRRDLLLNWRDRPELLPLYQDLAEDRDVKVRRFVLKALLSMKTDQWGEGALPIFQRRLQDGDHECRLAAACGVWKVAKIRDGKAHLLTVTEHDPYDIHDHVIHALWEMAGDDPELFEPLSLWAQSPIPEIRHRAVTLMSRFPKRGVPIIAKALFDPDVRVRCHAASYAWDMKGADAIAVMPGLISLRNDQDESTRDLAARVLTSIDPVRFPPVRFPPRIEKD